MPSPWKTELTRLTAVLLIAFLGGVFTGHGLFGLLLGLLAYMGWHLVQLTRLSNLLAEGSDLEPPFPSGLWERVYGRIRDLQIKSHKRKRRLSRFHSRFREAVGALPDAVVILNEQDGIEWCNPAALPLLGASWPQMASTPITDLIRHPILAEYLASEELSRPVHLPSPIDGRKMLAVRATPFGQEQERLLVARDITRIYHLDQVRRDFVANVSHELRTPLTVISGFLETMEESGPNNGAAPAIELMRQQTKRMQDTIDDLLVLSRLEMNNEQPEQETVVVGSLLEEIISEARTLSGEAKHRFELDIAPHIPLNGSSRELRTAFSNLIFNAVRHTPPGSEIRITWKEDEQGALLSVIDTGEGIAARHIPRLTERFYRVDEGRSRESGGTGLGLAIVKHILNRHDAELLISSKEGKGSTFSCRFPSARILKS
jgi:two-component system phosphate regulon sensor histidine kinase PhoR